MNMGDISLLADRLHVLAAATAENDVPPPPNIFNDTPPPNIFSDPLPPNIFISNPPPPNLFSDPAPNIFSYPPEPPRGPPSPPPPPSSSLLDFGTRLAWSARNQSSHRTQPGAAHRPWEDGVPWGGGGRTSGGWGVHNGCRGPTLTRRMGNGFTRRAKTFKPILLYHRPAEEDLLLTRQLPPSARFRPFLAGHGGRGGHGGGHGGHGGHGGGLSGLWNGDVDVDMDMDSEDVLMRQPPSLTRFRPFLAAAGRDGVHVPGRLSAGLWDGDGDEDVDVDVEGVDVLTRQRPPPRFRPFLAAGRSGGGHFPGGLSAGLWDGDVDVDVDVEGVDVLTRQRPGARFRPFLATGRRGRGHGGGLSAGLWDVDEDVDVDVDGEACCCLDSCQDCLEEENRRELELSCAALVADSHRDLDRDHDRDRTNSAALDCTCCPDVQDSFAEQRSHPRLPRRPSDLDPLSFHRSGHHHVASTNAERRFRGSCSWSDDSCSLDPMTPFPLAPPPPPPDRHQQEPFATTNPATVNQTHASFLASPPTAADSVAFRKNHAPSVSVPPFGAGSQGKPHYGPPPLHQAAYSVNSPQTPPYFPLLARHPRTAAPTNGGTAHEIRRALLFNHPILGEACGKCADDDISPRGGISNSVSTSSLCGVHQNHPRAAASGEPRHSGGGVADDTAARTRNSLPPQPNDENIRWSFFNKNAKNQITKDLAPHFLGSSFPHGSGSSALLHTRSQQLSNSSSAAAAVLSSQPWAASTQALPPSTTVSQMPRSSIPPFSIPPSPIPPSPIPPSSSSIPPSPMPPVGGDAWQEWAGKYGSFLQLLNSPDIPAASQSGGVRDGSCRPLALMHALPRPPHEKTHSRRARAERVVVETAGAGLRSVLPSVSGDRGLNGVSGDSVRGLHDLSGERGLNGVSGDSVTGLNDLSGDTVRGLNGLSRDRGMNGLLGNSVRSLNGLSGDRGMNGLSGDRGMSGLLGNSVRSVNGLSGDRGMNGLSGDRGMSGLLGNSVRSVNGLSGDRGMNGLSGDRGMSGLLGNSVRSVNGLSGDRGMNGLLGDSVRGLNGQSRDRGLSNLFGDTVRGLDGLSVDRDMNDLLGNTVRGLNGLSGDKGMNGLSGDRGLNGLLGNSLIGLTGDRGLNDLSGDTVRGLNGLPRGDRSLNGMLGDRGLNDLSGDLSVGSLHLTSQAEEEDASRRHKCPFCDVACTNNGQLKGHLRVHTGERPYRCECGRAFARNEELTRHRRIHSGLRPHVCDMCGKKFGRKDHLNKHQKTHLRTSEKKVHACHVPGCTQRYTRSDALARHQWGSHGIKAKTSRIRLSVNTDQQVRAQNVSLVN